MRRFDFEPNASENPANPFIIFPTADSSESARGTIPSHPNTTLPHSSPSLALSLPCFLSPICAAFDLYHAAPWQEKVIITNTGRGSDSLLCHRPYLDAVYAPARKTRLHL